MSTTITIRTDDETKRLLEERAVASGTSVSDVVRQILETELRERPLGERTKHLRGRISLPAPPSEPWRKQIRERNWRP